MTASLNKATLIGHIGKNPTTKITEKGDRLTYFSLATSQSWISPKGEKQESTDWLNIVAWNKLAEFAEKYIKKGKQIYCEGRIKPRKYTDRETNKTHTTYDIVANSIKLLGKKEEEAQPPPEMTTEGIPPQETSYEIEFDSDNQII
jgi:single-strand DNA-binding protein